MSQEIMLVSPLCTVAIAFCFILYILAVRKHIKYLKIERDTWKNSFHELEGHFSTLSDANHQLQETFNNLCESTTPR